MEDLKCSLTDKITRNKLTDNLNDRKIINVDGQYQASFREYRFNEIYNNKFPQYHFTDIKRIILSLLSDQEYNMVLGCVYRLTDLDIITRLCSKKCVQLVVNYEDFLTNPKQNWHYRLHERYHSLVNNSKGLGFWESCSHYFNEIFPLSAHNYQHQLSPIRAVFSNSDSMIHHKFLLLCKQEDIFVENGGHLYNEITPKLLVTGSFNLTLNASKSLENIIVENNSDALNMFVNEFKHCLLLSEPINATWNKSNRETEPHYLLHRSV